MGNIETTTKFSRLKSISSIDDNYLETPTGGVLKNKLFLKISKYSQENNCVGVAGLQTCKFIEKRLQRRCFPVLIANFLRTSILKNICNGCF